MIADVSGILLLDLRGGASASFPRVDVRDKQTDGIDTHEMRRHGGCIFVVPILSVLLFPSWSSLQGNRTGAMTGSVMVRREGQQIAGAADRSCGSRELTVVVAAKRFGSIWPGHLDVISYDGAGAEKRGIGAGNADRQRGVIAGKATATAGH